MSFYTRYKEWIDQPLHFLMVFIPSVLCIIHPIFGVIPSLMFALSREYYQRGRIVLWNLDLAFSYLGAVCSIAIIVLLT